MRQNGISEYRAELMAISMFAILLTHLKASFGVYALDRVALLCQGGVDVFLFLSGFGLYYSGMKSDNPLRFYSKRFKRIFPSFWVVMLLTFWLIDKLHWPNVLWGGSTLAFWFQSTNKYSFGWFVSLIVVLYAVFPWFFRLFRKHPKIATLFGVGVGLLLTGMYVYRYQVVYPGGQNRFILPAARVAIFFLGVYGAHWLETEKETSETVKRKEKWLLVSVALVGLLLLNLALNAWGFRTMRNTGLLYWVLRADNPWLSHCLCLDVPEDEGHKHRNPDTECLEAPGRLHARSLSIDSCCVQLCAVGEPAIGYFSLSLQSAVACRNCCCCMDNA